MADSTLNQVRQVVADVFNCRLEQVTAESSPETVENWDSLHHLNLVLALEERFRTRFDPWEAAELVSVAAIVRTVEEKSA